MASVYTLKNIFLFLTAPLRFLYGVITRKQYPFECRGTAQNVFLLGTLFQLRQAEQLIRYEGLQDNYLVVIAIPEGLVSTQIVLENADRKLFKFISTRTISPRSNNFAWNRFHELKRGYQTVFQKIKPRNFFVFNFESHYALAIYVAHEAGSTINLIEEGGTTYKMLPDRKLRTPFISFNHLPNKLFRWSFKTIPYYRKMQAVLDYWDTFHCLYVAFPEMLRGQMNAKRIVRFNMHAPAMNDDDADNHSQSIVDKYNITSNDFIFLSSRYKFQPLLYCLTVIKILKEIIRHTTGKIFIKLHPAEFAGSHKLFLEHIAKVNMPRIKLIGERDFLIEPVVRIIKPKAIFGFATATFLYTPELSPETKVFEITSWFIRELMAFPHVGPKDFAACEVMREQREFYSHFPGIVSIVSGEDFVRSLEESNPMEQPEFLPVSGLGWEDLSDIQARGQYNAILDALPTLVLPGENPEALRRLLFLRITLLAEREAAEQEDETVSDEPRHAALYRAYLAAKEQRHAEIVNFLSPVLAAFPPEEQRLFHPGVLLARAHRLLGNPVEAAKALAACQAALLHDPLWTLENARQAMDRGLWLKALCNFDWAYRNGVDSMPLDVADEYIRTLMMRNKRGLALTACKRVLGGAPATSGAAIANTGIPNTAIEIIAQLRWENAILGSMELLQALEGHLENSSPLFVELQRQKALNLAMGGLWPQVRSALEQLPRDAISSADCFLYWLALEAPGRCVLTLALEKTKTQSILKSRSNDSKEALIPTAPAMSGLLADQKAALVFQEAAQVVLPDLFFFPAVPEKNYPLLLSFRDQATICATPCMLLLVHIGLAYLDMLAENYDKAKKWLVACPQPQKATPLWQKTALALKKKKQAHRLQVKIDKSESQNFGYAFPEGTKAFHVYGKSLYWLVSFAGAADDIQIKITKTLSGNSVLRGTIRSEYLERLFQTQKTISARYMSEEKAFAWYYAFQPEHGDFSGYEKWRGALLSALSSPMKKR